MKTVLPSDLHQLLGGLTPAQFLRGWWHKKPLLIRNAIPGFKPLISKAQLFALAKQDEVESRIVTRGASPSGGRGHLWQLHHGPFAASDFRRLNTTASDFRRLNTTASDFRRLNTTASDFRRTAGQKWTLLVQGVNLHVPAADALLRRFSFIPYARIDDLMISYANQGGGVGPHFDSYDVFLLQAHGTRRWRVSMQSDRTLVTGAPLKMLKRFKSTAEYLLGPGDMLYLPPGCAHDGVATEADDCMTYSIGFRAPSAEELARGILEHAAETLVRQGFYADPALKPATRAALIDDAYVNQAARLIGNLRPTRAMLESYLGCMLSEPKANVFFDPPRVPLAVAAFLRTASRRGVTLDIRTQMLYRGKTLFINGEAGNTPLSATLAQLADARRLPPAAVARALGHAAGGAATGKALHAWYTHGWLHLGA